MGRFVPNPRALLLAIADAKFQAQMERLGQEGLAFAKEHVPYDETSAGPHIRDTLRIERLPNGGRRIVAGTDHWMFPEFGISDPGYPKQPYLRPMLTALGLRVTR